MITREAILQHMAEIDEERDRRLAELNALRGAHQCCEYWLSQIDEGEDETSPSDDKGE